uniref:Complement C1q tumor necrosis factor-related protein 4 n=1 Tax=Scleropages formosus TaxID=113540 RepID=A0A8C9VHN6_SCLFO
MLRSLLGVLAQLSVASVLRVSPGMVGFRSAFSAVRTSSLVGGSQMAVTFDRLLVNVGNDFNPDTGHFRCHIPGSYYFAYTVGKFPKKMLSVMLVKNRNEVQALVYNDHRNKGRKVQSQSVMINLKAMDTVWLLLHGSPKYALYSNPGVYVTFSGYLVYPRGEEPVSAFSAARTSSVLGEKKGLEKKDALTFDVEYVNVGGHFNKSSGRFTCHFPGVYYFAFTMGKHPNRALSVKLMMGAGEVQTMIYDEDHSRWRETQSQSLLLSLEKGDTVWLYSQQHERFAVYSNQGRYTTFTGFLVYPYPAQKNLVTTRF